MTIEVNADNTVNLVDFRFHFKKDDLGNKRPTVEVKLPVPTLQGVARILESGDSNQQQLLLDALEDVIAARARELLNEDENLSASNFPIAQVAWESIANLPAAEKKSRGIPKEQWEAFGKDYLEIMPSTGKKLEAVKLAAKLFLTKFSTVRTDKGVLAKLREQLGIYVNTSPNAENYSDIVTVLFEKLETYMNADLSKSMVDAL